MITQQSTKSKHYNGLRICSYNAIYNFIVTTRNYGKTWNFQYRAFKRAQKYGKKTVWLRRFKKEVKEASRKLYKSADLMKYCGIIPYDEKTKQGNFKRNGNTFYTLYKGKWIDFMSVYALSDDNTQRSADDVDIDTIVYDEFTTTPEKYKHYRGNEVINFIDIFISNKREHKVKCFFLGNKECFINPYFTYFNVPVLPQSYEGIRTFRKGSIAVEQCNYIPEADNEYEEKVNALLAGTTYGDYYLNAEYKNNVKLKFKKTPPQAKTYIQLNIDGKELCIKALNGQFFINNTIDRNDVVYSTVAGKYKLQRNLIKAYKRYFGDFSNAVADNRVSYANNATYEASIALYKWLNI